MCSEVDFKRLRLPIKSHIILIICRNARCFVNQDKCLNPNKDGCGSVQSRHVCVCVCMRKVFCWQRTRTDRIVSEWQRNLSSCNGRMCIYDCLYKMDVIISQDLGVCRFIFVTRKYFRSSIENVTSFPFRRIEDSLPCCCCCWVRENQFDPLKCN